MKLEEKRNYLIEQFGYCPVDDDAGIEFYYKAIHDYDFGLIDADDYAWLNTLLQYDIGADNAFQIIYWYYKNFDSTVQESIHANNRSELEMVCSELEIYLNFSNWVEEEPKWFKYGF